MLIDVHAHYSPKPYTETMFRIDGRRRPPNWKNFPDNDSPEQIDGRISLMDEAGVQMQMLSHGIMSPYCEQEADAVEGAHACNDAYADLARRYPDRFSAYAALPLPHIAASLKEMARCLDDLGMVGVTLNCSCLDLSTVDAQFEPLYEEMNRRGAVLYYHPAGCGICSPMVTDYGITSAMGATLEDTITVAHLVLRQIPIRYPNIKIIISHLGGMTSVNLQRMDHQMPGSPGLGSALSDREAAAPRLAELPSVTARRLYYDTVGHGSRPALLAACSAFGADHIVPGSDYPVLLASESYAETFAYIREAGLTPPEVDLILNQNAPALFGIGQSSRA
jgi:predicted TIM-barrel fold metal-dependent hydrolase